MPLRSDPGRLPRRNHYQEGPDLLFLTTQGGRPPTVEVGQDVVGVTDAIGGRAAFQGVSTRLTADVIRLRPHPSVAFGARRPARLAV